MPHGTARIDIITKTTDFPEQMLMYSKICLSSRTTDISQEQMPCTARSAYPSRATDISQEQMPHSKQNMICLSSCTAKICSKICLSFRTTDISQEQMPCTARSAYPSRATDTSQEQYSKICHYVQQDLLILQEQILICLSFKNYNLTRTDAHVQQDVILQELISHKNRCCTARYVSRTTDIS
ncbi:unnamed protein product [Mytilus edulis]|uniref:Uncharacterized protein n=1 Tax=Mytilus edulis TaxID=6550 RepID=A0A8S3Q4S6_MYTED|nr:unnamed protein product [Mytilus edulis]